MAKKLDVSIIIVTFNGWRVTKDCLTTLLAEPFKELIIVDNGSRDATKKELIKLEKKDQRIKLVFNKTNTGFAEGNNQGAEMASAKYICFLNNDTVVSQNFLRPLINNLEKSPKVAAVQPLIIFPDGTIDSVGSFLTWTGFLYHRAHRQKPNLKNVKPSKVYTLKGACMVWKKSVLDKIGLFDQSYFAYFEETELCHRALNKGFSLKFVPTSRITHLGGFTSNKLNQKFVQYHNTKNRFVTYLKHLPLSTAVMILPIHFGLTQALIFKYLLSDPNLAMEMEKGLIIGLIKGCYERFNNHYPKVDLDSLIKNPDIGYYSALFSSLKDYNKLW